MRTIAWLFGVALLVGAGAPAMAQDQAAQIKQEVEDFIKPLAAIGTAGEPMLSYGAIDVAAAGSAYMVTIPDLRWAPDATGHFEIGTVSFSLTPEGADLYHVGDVRIPVEIPHKTPDGGADGSISLPSQQFTAVWSRSLDSFLQLDADYRDVKIGSTADNIALSLGELGAKITSTDKGNGRWDQGGALHVSALNVNTPDGMFAVAAIDGTISMRDYNAKGWAAVRDRVKAITKSMSESPPASTPPTLDPQVVEALRNANPLFASWSSRLNVSAVSVRDATGKELLSLPTGALSLGAEGFDQPIGRIALSLSHAGLIVNDIAPTEQDMLPRELAVNVTLQNLPVQELWKGAIDALSAPDAATDQGASMAMMMFTGLLEQALIKGKARVDVTDSHLALALARAQLSGAIEASAESMFDAVGKMTVDVTGLDALIAAVMAHGGPQGEEIAGLEVLRGFSTRQTATDGSVTDHYDLDFTPQGQFLVNGKDFSFLGSGAGVMPPAEGGLAPDVNAAPAQGTTGDASPAAAASSATSGSAN